MFIGFCSRYITFYFILFYLNNQFKAYKGWFAPKLLCSQTLPSSPTTTKSSPSDPMTTSRANQVQYHPVIYTIPFTGDWLHTGEKDNGGLRMYSFIHHDQIPNSLGKRFYFWKFVCIFHFKQQKYIQVEDYYNFGFSPLNYDDFNKELWGLFIELVFSDLLIVSSLDSWYIT